MQRLRRGRGAEVPLRAKARATSRPNTAVPNLSPDQAQHVDPPLFRLPRFVSFCLDGSPAAISQSPNRLLQISGRFGPPPPAGPEPVPPATVTASRSSIEAASGANRPSPPPSSCTTPSSANRAARSRARQGCCCCERLLSARGRCGSLPAVRGGLRAEDFDDRARPYQVHSRVDGTMRPLIGREGRSGRAGPLPPLTKRSRAQPRAEAPGVRANGPRVRIRVKSFSL